MPTTDGYNGAYTGPEIDKGIARANQAITVAGSGNASMSETLGSGPYTIEFTEEAGSGESSGESFAIGDVRLTTKTELGENWVLANGTIISAEDYPKYVEEFPFKFGTSYKENLFGETSGPSGNSVLQYINGNYICVLQSKIYYASSPDANWTESVIIPAGSSGTINDFLFANGYYVAASQFYDSDHWVSQVWYASDLNGPWSAVDVHQSTGTASYGNSIQFINGQFVLMTTETISSATKYYLYTAQSPDGAWTAIPLDFLPQVRRIVYAEGKYVLCVMQQDENSTWHVGLKYASSLNGPWEYQAVYEKQGSFSPSLFTYLNGKYLIFQSYAYSSCSIFRFYWWGMDISGVFVKGWNHSRCYLRCRNVLCSVLRLQNSFEHRNLLSWVCIF